MLRQIRSLGLDPPAAQGQTTEQAFYKFPLVPRARSRYRREIVISRGLPDDEKLKQMPLRLPEELYEWVREAAHRRRVPMAELVREALREYRESSDPQIDLWSQRDAGR